jgi:hypothetical protein
MSDNPILPALARLEANQAKFGAGIAALLADVIAELGSTSGAIMEKVAGLLVLVVLIRNDIGISGERRFDGA